MQNLLEELKSLLATDERFVKGGQILKNKITEHTLSLDKNLIKLLRSQPRIRQHFFEIVEEVVVFDKIKFINFLNSKEFLPDSYTALKNKIGLTVKDHFIADGSEVLLSFPYKDCILEGGQTSEDKTRVEIFWNKLLAPDEIDRLLSPKAFSGFKKFASGTEEVPEQISETDNFIIKGNNLIALHTIKSRYHSKIKLIYIDPPYNTGSDGFKYNDSFNHSTWLTFMRNRLEVAKNLLTADGSIWINIDDNESHYLKVLCDEIFGRENFVINFIWQKKYAPSNDAKWFSDNHDHILVYAKNKKLFKPNLLPRTEEMNNRYSNPDNDPRGNWKPGGYSVKTYSRDYDYPITTPSGKIVHPPKGSCWQTSEANYKKMVADNRIWFGKNQDSKPQLKQFLSEVQQGTVAKSIWLYDEVGHNQISRSEIIKLFGEHVFVTPKPEKLLKRIIELASAAGDFVLDFFLGSGTTAAVAHKLKRKYVGIDQMDYIETVAGERLKKVIAGEDGGISKEVNWEGGGSFIYAEIAVQHHKWVEQILRAETPEELMDILNNMKENYALNYLHEKSITALQERNNDDVPMEDLRKLIMEMTEYNQLYVNYSEVADADNHFSEKIIALNHQFQNFKNEV